MMFTKIIHNDRSFDNERKHFHTVDSFLISGKASCWFGK